MIAGLKTKMIARNNQIEAVKIFEIRVHLLLLLCCSCLFIFHSFSLRVAVVKVHPMKLWANLHIIAFSFEPQLSAERASWAVEVQQCNISVLGLATPCFSTFDCMTSSCWNLSSLLFLYLYVHHLLSVSNSSQNKTKIKGFGVSQSKSRLD